MDYRINGLTPQALQYSRKTWWDGAFTRFVMDYIPLDTKQIVEIDCGLAGAAYTFLPALPEAKYFGADFNPERLAEAKSEMASSPLNARCELRLAPPDKLPVPDGFADVFLSIMSLQHTVDVQAVLTESMRVLQTGGRVVLLEPDNVGQLFYFNGALEEITSVFRALSLKARVARQPSDIALGPRLPGLLLETGFLRVKMLPYLVHSSQMETAQAFFSRLHRVAQTISSETGLPPENELLDACEQAIRRTLMSGIPKRIGFSCHIVPVFLCLGIKA